MMLYGAVGGETAWGNLSHEPEKNRMEMCSAAKDARKAETSSDVM